LRCVEAWQIQAFHIFVTPREALMTLRLSDLKPYKSLILARLVDDQDTKTVISPVLDDLKSILGLDDEPERLINEGRSRKIQVSGTLVTDETSAWTGFLHYQDYRVPSWYRGDNEEYVDVSNELVIVLQVERHLAIYVSDPRRRAAIQRCVRAEAMAGLGVLALIDVGLLNAAFVQGATRTLWLSAVHAPVPVKADTKTLSGLDLRDALDPLDDQTYHFTAARSRIPFLELPVGVSPQGSRIWVGATEAWEDFRDTVADLLGHLASFTNPEPHPLPVVAVLATTPPRLRDAFELQFVPPELLLDDPDIDTDQRNTMERWAYFADFNIRAATDETLTVDVTLEGAPLASLVLRLDATDPSGVKLYLDQVDQADGANASLISELKRVCRKVRWLKVWYESGHAIADGAVFEIRHRDEPFANYRWIDLNGYAATEEKFWTGSFPRDAIDQIGNEGSLFCWVRNNMMRIGNPVTEGGGWLACDDGAMEIADFIHVDDAAEHAVVSLIHVKGAKSNSPTRGISVSSYEVVVGQAVKNLRFLDRLNLGAGLKNGLTRRISQLVWHDGQTADRSGMLGALDRIGASFHRRIVVLQPHVTRTKLEEVRGDDRHPEVGRLRQLDTLLHAAQASSRDLSAERSAEPGHKRKVSHNATAASKRARPQRSSRSCARWGYHC
jgi:hypothetical protein